MSAFARMLWLQCHCFHWITVFGENQISARFFPGVMVIYNAAVVPTFKKMPIKQVYGQKNAKNPHCSAASSILHHKTTVPVRSDAGICRLRAPFWDWRVYFRDLRENLGIGEKKHAFRSQYIDQ
jgi:hypothetical protein